MTTIESPATKRIALVAHDNMKDELLAWAADHRSQLAQHVLVGTGTTGRLVAEHTGLTVERLRSGPLGGDQQLGGRIADGLVDILIFFWDPLEPQPHDPDIKALLEHSRRVQSGERRLHPVITTRRKALSTRRAAVLVVRLSAAVAVRND